MDKAFTQDILCEDSCSSQYIVESVIGLAEKFGINAVAHMFGRKECVAELSTEWTLAWIFAIAWFWYAYYIYFN